MSEDIVIIMAPGLLASIGRGPGMLLHTPQHPGRPDVSSARIGRPNPEGWLDFTLAGGNHFLLVGDLDSHVSTLAPHCFPLGTTSCSLRLEEESSTTRAPSAG